MLRESIEFRARNDIDSKEKYYNVTKGEKGRLIYPKTTPQDGWRLNSLYALMIVTCMSSPVSGFLAYVYSPLTNENLHLAPFLLVAIPFPTMVLTALTYWIHAKFLQVTDEEKKNGYDEDVKKINAEKALRLSKVESHIKELKTFFKDCGINLERPRRGEKTNQSLRDSLPMTEEEG